MYDYKKMSSFHGNAAEVFWITSQFDFYQNNDLIKNTCIGAIAKLQGAQKFLHGAQGVLHVPST